MIDMTLRQLKVYVISLPEDQHRREAMRTRFGAIYDKFEIIDGVRLPAKQSLADIYGQRAYDPMLTVAELGCALSHVSALENFLRSGTDYALILEDDAIGCAEDIVDISSLIQQLPLDAFLLCGGQEGLRGQLYNYGKPTSITGVFQIPEITKKFFTRACCYCVTRPSATHLLATQKKSLGLSDDWETYFRGWRNFFFTRKILHPTCLIDSNIEPTRVINKPEGEFSRIRRDGVRKVLNRFFSKLLIRKLSRPLGLIRIE